MKSSYSALFSRPCDKCSATPVADLEVEPPSELIFHISTFAPDMEPASDAVKAAASAVGLTAQRVKDVPGDYRITDKIMEMILSARIVVADLTHERPNVYFVLAMHAVSASRS